MGEVKRNLQKLINYHTSGETSMPSGSNVHYGEIVVRHNETKPELLIKVGEDKFATFVDVKAVEAQVKNSADAFDLKINGVSASVESNFATKASLESASGNIETTITSLKNALEGADSAIATELSAVSATVIANKSEFDSYKSANDAKVNALGSASAALQTSLTQLSGATEAEVARLDGRVDSAFTSAVTVASAYTDGQIAGVKGEIDAVEEEVGKLKSSAATLSTSLTELSGATEAEVARLDGRVDSAFTSAVTYVDVQVSAVTKSLQDKEDALDTRIKAVEVLTGTSESGVTSIVTKAITNVVSGAPAAFDTLAEIADWILQGSGATAAEIVTDIKNLKTADSVITSGLSAVSATVIANKSEFDGYKSANDTKVNALGSASAALQTSLTELSGATSAFSGAVVSEIVRLDGRVDSAFTSAVTYVDAQVSSVTKSLQEKEDALDKRIGSLEALSATTQSAIQSATTNSGVKVEKNGTTLDFDFSEIVIDCGEF
jgi:chaperonin cofactor prefoldin